MDRDSLEHFLEQGLSLEEIGRRMHRHPSTVGYWMKKYGLAAPHAGKHASHGGVGRHILKPLVDAGGTQRSIAEDLGVSVATVRHWLRRRGLETEGTRLRRESSASRQSGRRRLERVCGKHGRTMFVLDGSGSYRCLPCRRAAVAKRRRAVRAAIIQEAGGRCASCGYDAYIGALQFHHLDPNGKEFGLSSRGFTRSLERLRQEAKKCVLLCANCHAEVEGGVRPLPLKFRESLKGLTPGTDYPA
jgi:transposase